MTARVKCEIKLYTIGEWFEIAQGHFGKYSGMIGLEQAYYQSMKHKVCVNCLGRENLVLQTGRYLIKSTNFYMCQECLDWYKAKYAKDGEVGDDEAEQ